MGVIKKTVVLDDRIERFVRQTQAILLQAEPPIEATYSAALNFMLLGVIHEASHPGGLSRETREVIWDFARDNETLVELNLHERMDAVRSSLLRGEHGGRTVGFLGAGDVQAGALGDRDRTDPAAGTTEH
ncbi:MAG: hypothetical protein ACYCYK_03155 [Candidatus Dormibacteria bacterium]